MADWFKFPTSTPYFCVIGAPITHSQSPRIHAAFATQTGIKIAYGKVEVKAGEVRAALDEFIAKGGRGMNVTVPLKEEIYAISDMEKPRAAAARAANTITIDEQQRIVADNTDGVGLVRDLTRNLQIPLTKKRLLLAGAGGAARGALPALIAEDPETIVIANRTIGKARALVELSGRADIVQACEYHELAFQAPFDLIINATSLGLSGKAPPLESSAFGAGSWCYDLIYGAASLPFRALAHRQGVERFNDGVGMLVEQAAESFFLWHGVRPDTAAVIAALKRV